MEKETNKDKLQNNKSVNKYKNLDVKSIKKKKCISPEPIKYKLRFNYSTNYSGYNKNYFLYTGEESGDVKGKIEPGSLVQYVKKNDKKYGKMAIVKKVIKAPSAIAAWQQGKKPPPKTPEKAVIKFIGLDIDNPELESNTKEVYKMHLKKFFSYEKEICSNEIPKKIGDKTLFDTYNGDLVNGKFIIDYNNKTVKSILNKKKIMKKILIYYNNLFFKNKKFKPKATEKTDNSGYLKKTSNYYDYVIDKSSINKLVIVNKISKKKISKLDNNEEGMRSHKKIFILDVYVDLKLKKSTNKKIKEKMTTGEKIKDSISNLFLDSTSNLDCHEHKQEIKKILKSMKKKTKRNKLTYLLNKSGGKRKTKRKKKRKKTKRKKNKNRKRKTKRKLKR